MKQNIVFLPCRKGSQRVPNKNTRPFAGIQGGLLHIKLQQLLQTKSIDKIIVSSNDEEVLRIASAFNTNKIQIDHREDALCTSDTTTDQLIEYVAQLIPSGTVIWTHVTSPFLSAATYEKMIQAYYEHLNKYDSLMSVNVMRTFLWNTETAINYDRGVEKWPRTQTLQPLFEVNSGVFIADAEIYLRLHDRVGKRVYLYETSKLESIDIDWEEDFCLAEKMWNLRK